MGKVLKVCALRFKTVANGTGNTVVLRENACCVWCVVCGGKRGGKRVSRITEAREISMHTTVHLESSTQHRKCVRKARTARDTHLTW